MSQLAFTPETSTLPPPRGRQFGLRQLMLAIASVALVLGVGTQFGDASAQLAISVIILLIGAWWSWLDRSSLPLAFSLFFSLVWMCLLAPPVIHSGPARNLQCRNNVKQLSLALHNYASDNHGQFPPAYIADENGRPMHSWRVLILPYIEQDVLYRQYHFAESWDSPHNLTIAQQIPDLFQCPSRSSDQRGLFTSYVAVVGDETMWPGAESTSYEDITDGTTNTLCLLEWPESDIVWTEPRDFPSDRIWLLTHPPAALLSSKQRHRDGLTTSMADGQVRKLPFHELPGRHVRALFTRAGDDNDDLPP